MPEANFCCPSVDRFRLSIHALLDRLLGSGGLGLRHADCNSGTWLRWSAVGFNHDFSGLEQSPHGFFELGFFKTLLFCLVLSRELRRRVVWSVSLLVDVPTLGGEPAKQTHEHFVCIGFARELVEIGNSTFGKEETALITQHDGLAARTVLILLELDLAQVVLRLLATFGLDAFEVLPKPECAVPRCRAGD